MFHEGEWVFYGGTGVCKVLEIGPQKLSGSDPSILYYTLQPAYQNGVIYTPVSGRKVCMRPVISKAEAKELIAKIPTIHAEAFHCRATNELTEHYRKSIHSYDCFDLIKLTMSIYTKKRELEGQKRKFGSVDERFMKQAEELLFGELSVALEIGREEVPSYIAHQIGQASTH